MADKNEVDDAVIKMTENFAKALWTLVRKGAKTQGELASRVVLVADGALNAMGGKQVRAPRKRRKRKAAGSK